LDSVSIEEGTFLEKEIMGAFTKRLQIAMDEIQCIKRTSIRSKGRNREFKER
jgi:hypothetical protein